MPEPLLTVAGLDEAGRGPLAGPLVAALVVFPAGFDFPEHLPSLKFRDSKQLTRLQRERLISFIREFALDVRVEEIGVAEINEQGIGWANRAIFERLIRAAEADEYIVDGNLKLANVGRQAVRSVVRADETQQAVAAASIIAKVRRDEIMRGLHAQYPVYGWDHNMGYGTPAHVAALRQYGPCEQHRQRFVATALAKTLHLPGIGE